jgi:hypothetical protein
MKVKFKGEWYEIQCFNIKVKNGTGYNTPQNLDNTAKNLLSS